MKVVLDTNVLISALLFRRQLSWLAEAIEQGIVAPCFTVATLQEVARVLSYPKFQPKLRAVGLTALGIMATLLNVGIVTSEEPATLLITADPADNMFLACAAALKPNYIVSGDRHLLDIGEFQGIPIVSPKQLRLIFKER